ncbi:MAG: hypothetical protein ACI9U2_003449 [Bradymonadia bacterium]|jgi:uncharacterized protein (TIGR03382 family)
MQPRYLFAAALAFGGLMADAIARPAYPGRIPTPFSCSTCHFAAGGAGPRNPFGLDFPANGHTWAGVCELDSDGDGFTNGEELGDPLCIWGPGDPRPDFEATRTGDDTDFPMGPPPEPEAPEPEAPEPEAPEPEAPEPDAPEPEAPEPDAPEPDAPEPDAPEPDAPEPEAPGPEAPEPEAAGPEAPEPDSPEPSPTADMGVDGGGSGDSDDDGCNASAGAGGSAAPLFGLGALLLGLRRRRR